MSTTNTETRTLVGIAELATLFGVGRTTISNWYARQNTNAFPNPVVDLAMGPVWDQADVVAWWKGYTPLRNMAKVGTLPPELATEEMAEVGDVEIHSLTEVVESELAGLGATMETEQWTPLGVPSDEVTEEKVTETEWGTQRVYADGGSSISVDVPVGEDLPEDYRS
jgi:predicted DNA-binding transcriptional regulator AlpA